mmetsp:Transcript_85157/g.147177  ORF Transcript_85157/g.147177 Transcript_85157/m.147177 type:complete len:379 (+) Transcript_85157:62-1198(+)
MDSCLLSLLTLSCASWAYVYGAQFQEAHKSLMRSAGGAVTVNGSSMAKSIPATEIPSETESGENMFLWSASGQKQPMEDSERSLCVNRIGGVKNFSEMMNQGWVQIDAFLNTGSQKKAYWAWKRTACGGFNNGNAKLPLQLKRSQPSELLAHYFASEVSRFQKTRIMRKGGVAIDIGANNGDTTVPMALLADSTIAFEPNPEIFQILQKNVLLNKHLKIFAHNVGIAEKAAVLDFSYGGPCNGGVSGYGDKGGRKLQFNVVNLEAFLRQKYGPALIPKISFIKTDAEGFDYQILKSMFPLIKQICEASECPVIQVEWFDRFQTQDPETISSGSQKLFDVISQMPHGPWKTLCPWNSSAPIPDPRNKHHCKDVILQRAE